MGSRSKPKAEDYAPSELEKTQAAIAQEEQRYFKETYQPLLERQRDIAAREQFAPTLKGRAGADTMQALTSDTDLGLSQGVGQAGNLALGAIQQQLSANVDASNAATENQANVLATASGQRMTAGDALANAARLKMSEGLATAAGKQQVRLARNQALFNLGKAAVTQGIGNIASGGTFMSGKTAGMGTNKAGLDVMGTYDSGFFGLGRKNFSPYQTG
jgi:hypothetical protein